MKNRVMIMVATCLVIAFTVYLMSYSGITYTDGDEVSEKEALFESLHKKSTIEGDFIDRDGKNIFSPHKPFNEDKTSMPLSYSYILGYNSVIYGTSELRKLCRDVLYEDMDTGKGGTVQLTTNNILQNAAYEELRNSNLSGSIIIIDNNTGEILTCVSRKGTDYDACRIDEKFNEYNKIKGFFMPMATTDQDPPGSVYKIITTAAAIESECETYEYFDTGEYDVDDAVIHNYGNYSYGNETLQSAFNHSTNTYFASLTVDKIGEDKLNEISDRFYIGQKIQLDFATLKSNTELDGTSKALAFTSFGQGKLQMTPMHIAMIGQTVANDGEMLKPYILAKKINAKGKTVYNGKSEKLSKVLSKQVARKVKEIANITAEEKYPDLCEISPELGVKTGTAELGNGLNHSYFLAFDEKYTMLVSINNTKQAGGHYKYCIKNLLSKLYS